MTLLSPNHNYAADECMAQIHNHVPTAEERIRASERFDKDVLVAAHMAALHDAYILEMGTHPASEVVIKPSSPTASAIAGLRSSSLSQLKVGKVHRRRVLHGSLCAKTLCSKGPLGFVAVNVLEDEDGLATPLYLANVMNAAPNAGSAHAQRMFPQNSKVAVREPYLTRLPDGQVILLVEKPSDLVFISVPENVEEEHSINGDGHSFVPSKPKLVYGKYGNGRPKANGNGYGLSVNGTGNRRNSIATSDRSFVKPNTGSGGVENRRYSVGMPMVKDGAGAENQKSSFPYNHSVKASGNEKQKDKLVKNNVVEATSESSGSSESQLTPTEGYANGHGDEQASSSSCSSSVCQQVSSQNSSNADGVAFSNGEEGEVTSEPQSESLESLLIPMENINGHDAVNNQATNSTTADESLESELIPEERQNGNCYELESGDSHAESIAMVDNVLSENGDINAAKNEQCVPVTMADKDMSDNGGDMQNGDGSAAEDKASERESEILNGHCPAAAEHEVSISENVQVSIADKDISENVEDMENVNVSELEWGDRHAESTATVDNVPSGSGDIHAATADHCVQVTLADKNMSDNGDMQNGDGSAAGDKASEGESEILNGHCPAAVEQDVSIAEKNVSDDVKAMQNDDGPADVDKASEGESEILNGHCPTAVEQEVSIAEKNISDDVEAMQDDDGPADADKAREGENKILNGHGPEYTESEIAFQNSEHVGKCGHDKLDYKNMDCCKAGLQEHQSRKAQELLKGELRKPDETRYIGEKIAAKDESRAQDKVMETSLHSINGESTPKINDVKREIEIEDSATVRARGNAMFAKGDLSRAGELYTQAINRAKTTTAKPEQEVLALSNRAEVWLRLAGNMNYDVVNYEKALQDSEAALQLLTNHKILTQRQNVVQQAKALFRKGRALMGLRRYHEALTAFQQVQEMYPTDSQLQEAISQCKHRLRKALSFKPSKRQRASLKKKHHSIHQQQSNSFQIA